MSRAADRRRAQDDHLGAAEAQINARPNEPAPLIDEATRCSARLGGPHDFSHFTKNDPKGSGLTACRCWHCGTRSPRSREQFDAWTTNHKENTP